MQTRTADRKGRITLGERLANRTVLIEEIDQTEVRFPLARVIPEREAWLHENREAGEAVARGLKQGRQRRFAKVSDLDGDARIGEFAITPHP